MAKLAGTGERTLSLIDYLAPKGGLDATADRPFDPVA
jgi:hypothetical protein